MGTKLETKEEILIPNSLIENLLVDIKIDEDDVYLTAEIDGSYQECPNFIYSKFNILRVNKVK